MADPRLSGPAVWRERERERERERGPQEVGYPFTQSPNQSA